jgi:hypothetical protein
MDTLIFFGFFAIFAFILAIIFKLRPTWWFISGGLGLFSGLIGAWFTGKVGGQGVGEGHAIVGAALCILLQIILTKQILPNKTANPARTQEVFADQGNSQNKEIQKSITNATQNGDKILDAKQIFISYRRQDSEDIIGRIYDRLIRDFGENAVFKDVDSIPLGVDFRDHIVKELENCEYFLAVIGKDWLEIEDEDGMRRIEDTKDHVRIETQVALKKGIPVIPVLVRGAKVPPWTKLPDDLKDLSFRNGLSIRPDPDFHRDMDRLVEQIKQ